jgi:hypothetical protein
VARGQRAGHSRLQPPEKAASPFPATAPDPHIKHACRTRPSWIEAIKNLILFQWMSSAELFVGARPRPECSGRIQQRPLIQAMLCFT